MLEDDAVGPDWKLEQIPLFPIVAFLVDERVSGALDHDKHHAALAALLAAATPGRNLLRIEHDELMRRGIDVGMHVPLHHALGIDFPGQLAALYADTGAGGAPGVLIFYIYSVPVR